MGHTRTIVLSASGSEVSCTAFSSARLTLVRRSLSPTKGPICKQPLVSLSCNELHHHAL